MHVTHQEGANRTVTYESCRKIVFIRDSTLRRQGSEWDDLLSGPGSSKNLTQISVISHRP